MTQYKVPSTIIMKLRNVAPSYDISENYGRRGGYYGEEDESACSYKNVCVYVQNGLGDKLELFREIAKAIFKIQKSGGRTYMLIVFSFGVSENLQHDRKFFPFGYFRPLEKQ